MLRPSVSGALLLLFAVNLTAQNAAPPAASQNITLDVSVTDKAGKAVPGLKEQDFTVLDNKKQKSILTFHAVDMDNGGQGPPVEMVIVIDAINADVLKAERQRDGIRSFLLSNGGKLPMPVSLITLTDQDSAKPATAPSQDGNEVATELDQSITGLRTVHRGTMYDDPERFQLSIKALDSIVQSEGPKPGRKLIVWVSPGWPLLARVQASLSAANQQQIFNDIVRISTILRLAHITLYNVASLGVGANVSQFWYYTEFVKGVKSVGQAYLPNLALQVLCVQSGGLVLNRSNDIATAMGAEISQAAEDGRSFYIISFPASQSERPNEYHTLEIKTDQPGLTARTRTGYYAQP
jgi:VWFA-related protein